MDRGRRVHGLLREPLLHFLLLGACLFGLHAWLDDAGALSTRTIVIDRGRVEQLAAGFASLHQRPPMADELQALIDDAVKEEIFYREALAPGLDRNDTIVRRRMRQKLEFVSEDIAPVPVPTDAQLQSWLDAHPAAFLIEPRYTFEQVFLGKPLLLPRRFDAASEADVRALFGARFATALGTLAPGKWQGPIQSGYGAHLVRLVQRDPGRAPLLAEAREKVRREWTRAQREAANARFYAALRKRYDVRISVPAPAGTSPNTLAELRP